MRLAASLLVVTVLAASPACGQSAAVDGSWSVDLSVKADEPYTKDMTLALAPDGSVTGSFYDSAIEAGRWKTDRGRTCVSFRTTDGAGPYHTSACLAGDTMQGQTWAEHRAFLFNWNAVRKAGGE
jgi:hypothetical protein